MQQQARSHEKWIVGALTFCALWLHHQSVFFYFDDYGYATLSYVVEMPYAVGANYGWGEILAFCIQHWLQWGGRVLYYFFYIAAAHTGLWAVRLLQSVLLALILYFSSQSSSENHTKLARTICCLLPVICFFLIQQPVHKDGTYWFAAAAGYVWPFAVLLPVCWGYEAGGNTRFQRVLLLLGAFAAGFSQEQIALVSGFVLSVMAFEHIFWRHEKMRFHIAIIVSVWLGAAMVLCAPGNTVRSNTGGVAIDPLYNLPFLVRYLCTDTAFLWMSILTAAAGLFTLFLLCNSTKKACKILWGCGCALWFACSAGMLIWQDGIFNLLQMFFGWDEQQKYIILLFLILLLTATAGRFYTQMEHHVAFLLFLGGGAAVVAMLFSPTIPLRLLLPFFFATIPMITDGFCAAANLFTKQKLCAGVLTALFLLVGLMNAWQIFIGYAANAPVLQQNDTTMRQAAQAYQQEGNAPTSIHLRSVPNTAYAGVLPSDGGSSWYLHYYGLPENIELIYS